MIKAREYKEYNVISLHTHLGGTNAELEIGSGKKKDDIIFDDFQAQKDIEKLINIGFNIIGLTNHNVLSVDNYLKLKNNNKDILLLPGIECDVKIDSNPNEIIHLCIIFDDSISEDMLKNIAKKYNDFLLQNKDNFILVKQLFKVLDKTKVIIYPHGNKKKGISYTNNNGELINNENIYNEICNLEEIYPFFIDVNQEFHKYTLREKIANFYVSDYKKSLSHTNFLVSVDRENDFSNFPFTYFWGDMNFNSIYMAGLIGNTKRFVQEKDIIDKSPYISRLEIKEKKSGRMIHNLKFSHGINTIIGDSGSGKTLLLNYLYKLISGDTIPSLTTTNTKGNYDEVYNNYSSILYDENNDVIEMNSIKPYIGKNIYRRFILALDENNKIAPKAIFENLNIKENTDMFYKLIGDYENRLNMELKRRRNNAQLKDILDSSMVTFSNSIKSIISNRSDNIYNFASFGTDETKRIIRTISTKIKTRITDYIFFKKLVDKQIQILGRYEMIPDTKVLERITSNLFHKIKKDNTADIKSLNNTQKTLLKIEWFNNAIRSVDIKNGEKTKKQNQSIELNRQTTQKISSTVLKLKNNHDEEETDLKLDPDRVKSSIILQESIENVEIITEIKDSLIKQGFFEEICQTVKGKGNIPVARIRDYSVTSDKDVSSFIDEFVNYENINIVLEKDYKKYVSVDIKIKGFEETDVTLSEMSAGMLSKFYIRVLINNEIKKMNSDAIILFDEPDASLSKTFIFGELVKKFKELRIDNQIFFTTHEPLLIVNADSNNLICCENTSKLLDGIPKFRFESGSMVTNKFFSDKQVNNIDDVIDLFADMIDGSKQAIKTRNKIYLGGTHFE